MPFEIYGDNDDGMVAVIAPVRDIHLYTVTTIRETEIACESAVYQKHVIKLTAKLIRNDGSGPAGIFVFPEGR